VREILTNPKYIGYTAWNRRATKHRQHPGKPIRKPVGHLQRAIHPPLVSMDRFVAAQTRERK
jgi:hypothetical protein